MPADSDSLVLIEKADPGVVVLSLNRPEKRNALNGELMDAICLAITDIEAERSHRVMVLRGEGPAFCSGMDLREAADTAGVEHMARSVERMLLAVYRSRLISVAAVRGIAAGGGAGLMSACDLVVAAADARIGYPEVQRGLVAALVMTFLIRQVGDRRAREMVLLGEMIDATQAHAMGLVNRVVPRPRVLESALEMAKAVLFGAPDAVVHTKRILEELAGRNMDEELARALQHHLTARSGAEAQEGLAAFLEKRAPAWERAKK